MWGLHVRSSISLEPSRWHWHCVPAHLLARVCASAFAVVNGVSLPFDLLLTNHSAYNPYNASLNLLNGLFANVNLACNEAVDLRISTVLSCATTSSCVLCDRLGALAQASCWPVRKAHLDSSY